MDDIYEIPALPVGWRAVAHNDRTNLLWHVYRDGDTEWGRVEYQEGLTNGPFIGWANESTNGKGLTAYTGHALARVLHGMTGQA